MTKQYLFHYFVNNFVTNHWFLGLIWFDTSDEERVALTQLSHQRI